MIHLAPIPFIANILQPLPARLNTYAGIFPWPGRNQNLVRLFGWESSGRLILNEKTFLCATSIGFAENQHPVIKP